VPWWTYPAYGAVNFTVPMLPSALTSLVPELARLDVRTGAYLIARASISDTTLIIPARRAPLEIRPSLAATVFRSGMN
jgi:hypothetical protein